MSLGAGRCSGDIICPYAYTPVL